MKVPPLDTPTLPPFPPAHPNGNLPFPVEIPLGTGPPTREELLKYYPSHFTWSQLKTFIAAGDLGLLKRDKALQERYQKHNEELNKEWGSVVQYLKKYRLQWGKRDVKAKLVMSKDVRVEVWNDNTSEQDPGEKPVCFTRDIHPRWVSVIANDWPYSVPPEVEHSLIWTLAPIFHPSLIHPSIAARIEQDGLFGFTGMSPPEPPSSTYLPASSPPPSPTLLPTRLASALPALLPWGVTMDKLIISPRDYSTPEGLQKEDYVQKAGEEVHEYVKKLWSEDLWETAWFVNPPRLQSVPGLAHVHVFARRKDQAGAVHRTPFGVSISY